MKTLATLILFISITCNIFAAENKPIVVYDVDKIVMLANKARGNSSADKILDKVNQTIYNYTSSGYAVIELHPGKAPPSNVEKDITQEIIDAAGLSADGKPADAAKNKPSSTAEDISKLACTIVASSRAISGPSVGKYTSDSPPFTQIIIVNYAKQWAKVEGVFIQQESSITNETIDINIGANLGETDKISIDRMTGNYYQSRENTVGSSIWLYEQKGKCAVAHQQF